MLVTRSLQAVAVCQSWHCQEQFNDYGFRWDTPADLFGVMGLLS